MGMSKVILAVAPHPDDETLGCGGTLLRHVSEGDDVHWLIVTEIHEQMGFPAGKKEQRADEIIEVAKSYGFSSTHLLHLPTIRLDAIPIGEIIEKIGSVFKEINPEVIYLPFSGDVHTDHIVVADAVTACTKWFRYGSVKRVLAYETISETDFGLNPATRCFNPNVYVNIGDFLEKKLDIMRLYKGELGEFPFPRSEKAIRALAALRGAAAGCEAAEAFVLLKEIY